MVKRCVRCFRWRFSSQELGDSHWVSVACGPLDAIVDAWGVRFRSLSLTSTVQHDLFQPWVKAYSMRMFESFEHCAELLI